MHELARLDLDAVGRRVRQTEDLPGVLAGTSADPALGTAGPVISTSA